MPKCSGCIGYVRSEEIQPGIWSESMFEKKYYGEVISDNKRVVDQGEINSSFTLSNSISIVSNKFILDNLAFMKYVTWNNSKWKIESAEIKPPRIIIRIGGLFNE